MMLVFLKLAESPRPLKMLSSGMIHATRPPMALPLSKPQFKGVHNLRVHLKCPVTRNTNRHAHASGGKASQLLFEPADLRASRWPILDPADEGRQAAFHIDAGRLGLQC